MKYLTVKEVIAILQELDEDALVLLSRDPEGNGFSPVAEDHSVGFYNDDEQDFYSQDDFEYMKEEDDMEEEVPLHPKAIVLWPMY